MNVKVGTSGYSFKDWVGNFYPPGTRPGDMLSFYTRYFPVVEVNSTYYRIPAPQVLERMAAKTPPGFEFIVKAHQEMTHERSRDPAVYSAFREALKPVEAAGKFRGVLGQFPWGFKRSPPNREHLEFMREALAPAPFFVEFRHASWIQEPVFQFLKELGVGYCSVDEPALRGLVPPVARATGKVGYVRLHGRNAANWWGRGGGDRYDYDYSRGELEEWARKIRSLAEKAERIYVFFNNCHAGHAARNARLMQEMLAEDG